MKFYQKIRTIVDTAGNTRDLIFSADGISTKYNDETECFLLYGTKNITESGAIKYTLPYDILPGTSTSLGNSENKWQNIYCNNLYTDIAKLTAGDISAESLIIGNNYTFLVDESDVLNIKYNSNIIFSITSTGILTVPVISASTATYTDLTVTGVFTLNGKKVGLSDVTDLSITTAAVTMTNPKDGIFFIYWICNNILYNTQLFDIETARIAGTTTYTIGTGDAALTLTVTADTITFTPVTTTYTKTLRARILLLGA